MKVVTLSTLGWMVGRTWIPEDLLVLERCIAARSKGLPIPNEANMFAGEVDIVVPIRGVEKSTLVLV